MAEIINIDSCQKILQKYPNRVPIILHTNKIKLSKTKYLVNNQLPLGAFMFILRKNVYPPLDNTQSLYIFFNDTIVPNNTTFETIYKNYKNEDGFLYANITVENAFG